MKYLSFLSILIVFYSCKDSNQAEYITTSENIEGKIQVVKTHPGKKLLETQCYVCHNPKTSEGNRIAPPMIAIKAHYISGETKKEDFIRDIRSFIDSPSVDKARMRGAVRKFGVMPYQPFKKEDINNIAEYLFDYQIEEPGWFKDHWQKGHKKRAYINSGKTEVKNTPNTTNYEEVGLRYALATKAVLGKNLMREIQQHGTVAALRFCNEKAQKLTDSMAKTYNVKIKRVSDKPRNIKNQANNIEMTHIASFKTIIASGATIQPIVKKNNKKVNFYYPITTNTMCLQCHGKPNKDIPSNVLNSLVSLYPDDNATEYGTNEVRGIWSIGFDVGSD